MEATFGKLESENSDLTLEQFLKGMTARNVKLRPKKGKKVAAGPKPAAPTVAHKK